MSHSCVENHVHLIFATKERAELIIPEIECRLHQYITGIARRRESPILIVNGVVDHIHILIRLHPSVALATVVKELKAYSTGWMKKQGCEQFSWQKGYGGFSVSRSALESVMAYISRQKEHHKKYSFEDELDSLIEKWNLQWSPF